MTKRVIAIIMAVMLCVTLIACSNQAPAQSEKEESGIISSDTTSVTTSEEQKDKSVDTTTVYSEKTTDNSTPSSESKGNVETKPTEKKTVETTVEPPKKTESSSATKTESIKTTEKNDESTTDEPAQETHKPVEDTEPVKIKTPTAQEVESKVVEYINQYRVAQGQSSAIVLNGLNNVAKYRAKQLVNNYEHVHPRKTSTELKYGMYVDLTPYGLPETDNYYEGFDKEALCKGDWYGTADQIASAIATGFKNSSVHWNYVGQSKYQYMGVGIYYDESTERWYGCICMSKENYGG